MNISNIANIMNRENKDLILAISLMAAPGLLLTYSIADFAVRQIWSATIAAKTAATSTVSRIVS